MHNDNDPTCSRLEYNVPIVLFFMTLASIYKIILDCELIKVMARLFKEVKSLGVTQLPDGRDTLPCL